MTLPPQSPEISSTNFWPKPVEPRGFGATTTQPCAAHSDGIPARRPRVLPRALRPAVDQEDDRILRFEASKLRRLDQPVLNRRTAGARHRQALGRARRHISRSQASFSCVSAFSLPPAGIDAGRARAATSASTSRTTTKPSPGVDADDRAALARSRLGAPPAAGTTNRCSRRVLAAVNQIDAPSFESAKSSTDRSGVAKTVRFAAAGAVVGVEIPAIRLEAGTPLRAHEDGLAVG